LHHYYSFYVIGVAAQYSLHAIANKRHEAEGAMKQPDQYCGHAGRRHLRSGYPGGSEPGAGMPGASMSGAGMAGRYGLMRGIPAAEMDYYRDRALALRAQAIDAAFARMVRMIRAGFSWLFRRRSKRQEALDLHAARSTCAE
jgi:hypothetical protein